MRQGPGSCRGTSHINIGFCCWRCSHSVRRDWNCLLAAAVVTIAMLE